MSNGGARARGVEGSGGAHIPLSYRPAPPRLHAPQRVVVARGRLSVTDHEPRARQHSPRIDRSAQHTRGLNAGRNVEEENVRHPLSDRRRVSESVFLVPQVWQLFVFFEKLKIPRKHQPVSDLNEELVLIEVADGYS